jgi:uncharacterized protein YggE
MGYSRISLPAIAGIGTRKTERIAMKKVLLALCLALFAPALAHAESRTLTMAGHGEVRAAPDMVRLTAGVVSQAPTAAAALAANSARMKAVFAALDKLGTRPNDIQTRNFSVSPRYAGGDTPRLTGYEVSNQVSVRLSDTARLGAALDALVTAGANRIDGVDFAIAAPAPLLEKARAEAVADAKARAGTYARAAGVTLGPILSISEGGAGPVAPRPMMFAAKAVPVAAGEESVSADVTLVWEIR